MKRTFSLLMTIIMLLGIMGGMSISAQADDFSCGKGAIASLDYETGRLVISGEGSVTGNFKDNKYIKTVVVEKGITSLCNEVFSGCDNMKSISLPITVTKIGEKAFINCKSLTEFNLPAGLKEISSSMFYGCEGLKSVTIPSNIVFIGSYAFGLCSNISELKIEEGVQSCGWGAFHGCNSLTNVVLPNSFTLLGTSAFSRCENLQSITIPKTIQRISDAVFWGCKSLKNVELPDLTSIPDSIFRECTSLTSYTIPKSVKAISRSAFQGCTALEELTIDRSLEGIDASSFQGCTGLKKINYNGTMNEWKAIGMVGSTNTGVGLCFVQCTDGGVNCKHNTSSELVKAATISEAGALKYTCSICSYQYEEKVAKIVTATPSKSEYTYNGKAKTPSIKVKDENGSVISKDNYTVTYKKNTNAGKAFAIIELKGNYTGTIKCEFDILPKLSADKLTILAGQKATLKVKGTKKASFSISDKSVASVDSDGNIKAKKAGRATITVDVNGVKSKCVVTVKNPKASFKAKRAYVLEGRTAKLQLDKAYIPSGATVKWSSSNRKIATVDKNGKVTGVKAGKVTIKATFKYKGKTYKGTCKLTCETTEQAIERLTLEQSK